jgi:hypothetical protein
LEGGYMLGAEFAFDVHLHLLADHQLLHHGFPEQLLLCFEQIRHLQFADGC